MSRRRSRLTALGVTMLAAGYLALRLRRGWMPFDDGALAQSAERVLFGELPHRDFDDVYTGGLALLDAGAFRVLGTTLLTLRVVLFAAFLVWVPAVYTVARRFTRSSVGAAVATVAAVVWSVPNYTAAMPSWYNLFLATFGLLALLRHTEDGRSRWLLIAGVMGGLSFLVKVVGLYYVAGALLYLVFAANQRARRAAAERGDVARGRAYAAFVTVSLVAFVAALGALVRRQVHAWELVQLVLAPALLAAFLVRGEWSGAAGASRHRVEALARVVVPFLLGVALPVAVFLVPYATSGALVAFVHGVFVLPARRFGIAEFAGLPLWTIAAALVPAAVIAGSMFLRGRWPIRVALAVAAALLLLWASGHDDATYRGVWYSARNALPLIVVAGVVCLARGSDAREQPERRAFTMAALSVAALCNLVQFPYAVPNYFCYVAPLVLLALLGVSAWWRDEARTSAIVLLAFYGLFAVLYVNDSTLNAMGVARRPYFATEPLPLARAGLRIPRDQVAVYRRLIPMVRARARGGYTWASPDVPEVYFLSGLRNPTRTLFDFFDDPTDRSARVLRALDEHGVTAVVLNRRPAFSAPVPDDLVAALEERYPYAADLWPFQLRWRP